MAWDPIQYLVDASSAGSVEISVRRLADVGALLADVKQLEQAALPVFF